MHPGVVDSNFVNHADASMQAYMRTLTMETPDSAADTLVWLASSPEAGESNGLYFYRREAIEPAAMALDDAMATRLWTESDALVAAYR